MNRSYVIVTLSLFTWGLGEGLFLYFQPLYLQRLGADPVLIGTILGVMGLVMALAQIPAGILSDKIGSHTLMIISWLIGTVAAILMALAKSLPLFAIGVIFYGASAFSTSAINRYIISVRGKFSVGRALTLTSGMYNLGAVLGPVSGGRLAQRYGFSTLYLVAFVIFVISTLLLLLIEKNPPLHHEDQQSIAARGISRNSAFMVFAGIIFFVTLSMFLPQPLTPNFLQNQQSMDAQSIGILGSIGNLGNALTMLLLGSVRPIVGMIIGQAMVTGFSILFLLGNSPLFFGIGYFLFGGFRLSRTMVLAFARPLVHPEETGLAFGILDAVASFAIILAPVIAGVLYDHTPRMMYEIALLATIVSIILTSVALPRIQSKILPETVVEMGVTQDDQA
jgi:MFS family permease